MSLGDGYSNPVIVSSGGLDFDSAIESLCYLFKWITIVVCEDDNITIFIINSKCLEQTSEQRELLTIFGNFIPDR